MLPTPETPHIDGLPVYPPSEDSFLLLDAFEAQSDFLKDRFPSAEPLIVNEIGTGSGVVVAFLTAHSQQIFGREHVTLFALDINPHACKAAQTTTAGAVTQFGPSPAQFLGCYMGDLAGSIRDKTIDLLIFNPPYVPSDEAPETITIDNFSAVTDFEVESRLFDLAVSGGPDGMVTTWRLINQLDRVLTDRGAAYILLCARNRPVEVMQKLQGYGWEVAKIHSSGKQGGIEKLCIIRVSRRLRT